MSFFYLKFVHFDLFYLKMIKGLFQISSTFLFPIKFDHKLTASFATEKLRFGSNGPQCKKLLL